LGESDWFSPEDVVFELEALGLEFDDAPVLASGFVIPEGLELESFRA
jgi:hypothetical protein